MVQVRTAGICGTDLALYSGDFPTETPLIPGHEFCGVVTAIGEEVESDWMGTLVASEITLNCLTRRDEDPCPNCRRRLAAHCCRRRVLGIRGAHGAFAERIRVPVAAAHRLPEGFSTWAGALVEPVAAAIQTFERTPIEATDTVVVLGAGRLGLLVTRIAASFGARVIAASRSETKRELAVRFGAAEALDASAGSLPSEVKERTEGLGADVVVECTGRPEGVATALSIVRPLGTIALKSTPGIPVEDLDLTGAVVDEIRLQGSRCGPFEKAIDRLAAGRIPVDDFVAGVFPLEDIEGALRASQSATKILIEFPEPPPSDCGHGPG